MPTSTSRSLLISRGCEMGALTNIFGWPSTTLVDVFKEAEGFAGNRLEMVEMELASGGSFAIAVISGPHTEQVVAAMRAAKQD